VQAFSACTCLLILSQHLHLHLLYHAHYTPDAPPCTLRTRTPPALHCLGLRSPLTYSVGRPCGRKQVAAWLLFVLPILWCFADSFLHRAQHAALLYIVTWSVTTSGILPCHAHVTVSCACLITGWVYWRMLFLYFCVLVTALNGDGTGLAAFNAPQVAGYHLPLCHLLFSVYLFSTSSAEGYWYGIECVGEPVPGVPEMELLRW